MLKIDFTLLLNIQTIVAGLQI